jgi:ketosteroid isomerase-like protein
VKGFRSLANAWENFAVAAEEYHELEDERVLVLSHFSGHGKTSGLELERITARAAGLYHFRDGKVTRAVHYWDRERALADVGLPEQDAHWKSSPS